MRLKQAFPLRLIWDVPEPSAVEADFGAPDMLLRALRSTQSPQADGDRPGDLDLNPPLLSREVELLRTIWESPD